MEFLLSDGTKDEMMHRAVWPLDRDYEAGFSERISTEAAAAKLVSLLEAHGIKRLFLIAFEGSTDTDYNSFCNMEHHTEIYERVVIEISPASGSIVVGFGNCHPDYGVVSIVWDNFITGEVAYFSPNQGEALAIQKHYGL
jgi:hypothetical protein